MRVIFVDIDETICVTPDNPRVYEEAKPISYMMKETKLFIGLQEVVVVVLIGTT